MSPQDQYVVHVEVYEGAQVVAASPCGIQSNSLKEPDPMISFGRSNPSQTAQSADEQAIARYRYMLKTAPPETIEQAHAEAFAQLTPEQRRRCCKDWRDGAGLGTRHGRARRRNPASAGADGDARGNQATGRSGMSAGSSLAASWRPAEQHRGRGDRQHDRAPVLLRHGSRRKRSQAPAEPSQDADAAIPIRRWAEATSTSATSTFRKGVAQTDCPPVRAACLLRFTAGR